MKNCKNFKIYKFKFAHPSGSSTRANKERWKRAEDLTSFQIKLIDEFCSLSFKDLRIYSFLNEERICYKKDWLISPFEIGQDMLQEEMGIEFHYYWDQLYVAVPITKTDIIKFFDDNVPNWVTTVKRI